MKRWLIVIFFLAVVASSVYYRREAVLGSAVYTDPLRYERMSAAGISVDYVNEPVLAWKIVSGSKKLELTGGGQVLTCMDEHLLLSHPFETSRQPATLGEALDRCKAGRAK